MAGDDDGQEKSHEPTDKRRQEFRDKGQVPQSREVLSAFGLAFGSIVFLIGVPAIGQSVMNIFVMSYSSIPTPGFEIGSATLLAVFTMAEIAESVGPPLALLWVFTAVLGFAQMRGAIKKEPFKPEWEKFNVFKSAQQQFFSLSPLVEGAKGLLKLFLISWLVWVAVEDRVGLLPTLVTQQPGQILQVYEEMVLIVLTRSLPVAFIVAIMDYGYQWYRNHEQMMMTREEVKEEQKSSEGDPYMKAARKRRAQEISMARTVQEVKNADVVITNPTHYAVALRYRKSESKAPVVVARGFDHVALKIKAEARRHDIPQVEDRTLARALFARSKEGKEIPEELFGAVARVLATIWRRKGGPPKD